MDFSKATPSSRRQDTDFKFWREMISDEERVKRPVRGGQKMNVQVYEHSFLESYWKGCLGKKGKKKKKQIWDLREGRGQNSKGQKYFPGWHVCLRPRTASSDHTGERWSSGENHSQGPKSKSAVLSHLCKWLLISQTCLKVWIKLWQVYTNTEQIENENKNKNCWYKPRNDIVAQ